MVNYRYRAMTSAGTVVAGVLEAPTQAAALQLIRGDGHFPIAMTDERAGWRGRLAQLLTYERKSSQRDLAIIMEEFASLLSAGLELDRALGVLLEMDETAGLRETLATVRKRVRDGESLSDTMEAEPVFPRICIGMIRAGEVGGDLAPALRRLSDYLARTGAIREAVGSALIYPIILLCTAGLSIVVILIFVIPEFALLFEDAGKPLPWATRIVLAAGEFLSTYWPLLVIAIAAAVIAYRNALKKTEFRLRRDTLLLRLPLIGALLNKIELERFSRTLGTLLDNGVPLSTALGVVKDTAGNAAVAKAIHTAAGRMREGEKLSEQLAQTKIFPPLAFDLVRVGEETGRLEEMLLRQAEFCERNIKHSIDRLLAILTPALTILLGFLVAGLIASMLVAIISINDLAV
jgi:general secretion pathway protein F